MGHRVCTAPSERRRRGRETRPRRSRTSPSRTPGGVEGEGGGMVSGPTVTTATGGRVGRRAPQPSLDSVVQPEEPTSPTSERGVRRVSVRTTGSVSVVHRSTELQTRTGLLTPITKLVGALRRTERDDDIPRTGGVQVSLRTEPRRVRNSIFNHLGGPPEEESRCRIPRTLSPYRNSEG